MQNELKASIIIPAFNEEDTISDVLESLAFLKDECEIIVVDDGSIDKTYELAKRFEYAKVVQHPYNKGYGAALKTGIREASSDIVVFFDADGQHNPGDIEKIVKDIGKYDMVVGARPAKSASTFFRKPGKKLLNVVANILAERRIPDLNSGFRAIKKDVVTDFFHILPNGFSFSTTITLALLTGGFNVNYVPIKIAERAGGKSTVKFFRDGARTALLIIRCIAMFNPLKIFFPPSVGLILLGFSYLIFELIKHRNIPDGAVLLLVSGITVFFFGILSDQISALSKKVR